MVSLLYHMRHRLIKRTLRHIFLRHGYKIVEVSDKETMDKIYQYRYRMYCLEHKFLDPKHFPDQRESDKYDKHAVHIAAVDKQGDVFTTAEDRESNSPWNTYKYPGLPMGPISNPSLESIISAIYPEKNNYWYFLTTFDGEVKYAKNLDEHNANVYKYLR